MTRKEREPVTPEAARLKAMRLLGRREHSAKQLSRKLKAGGVEDEVAGEVIGSLVDSGWQSDPRFAESLIRNRIAQGYGPLRIRAELSVAGLDEALIREALDAADCDWTALAVETQARRFSHLPQSMADRQKQWRTLAQRGFTGEQIRVALKGEPDGSD